MFKHFPHLTTIALSYLAAVLLLFFLSAQFFQNIIVPFGILGVLFAGALYTYGFTSAVGAILLIALAPHYPAGVIAVVGGIGGAVADFSIFRLIRHDLKKEVEKIGASTIVQNICGKAIFCENWFRTLLGVAILASPIPDEFGIALLGASKMDKVSFVLLTFMADAIGIYVLVSAVMVLGQHF